MLNRSQKKELIEEYYFLSKDEIAEKYKMSDYELKNFIKAEGLRPKVYPPLTKEQRQYILDNPLKKYSVIARELGITWAMVDKILKWKRRKYKKLG